MKNIFSYKKNQKSIKEISKKALLKEKLIQIKMILFMVGYL